MESELAKITKLKGAENWAQWKFQISVLLRDKEAMEVANGELPKPMVPLDATAPQRQVLLDWVKRDNAAQKLIATTLSDSQLVFVMHCTSSKDMWNALHALYEQKSDTSIHMLQQKWYQIVKDPKDNMASHLAKLKDLAHRLEALGEPVGDSMIMTKILMTLPASYGHFITAWQSTAPDDRKLTNLVERLLAEETRHLAQESEVNEALAAMKPFKGKPKRKPFQDSSKTTGAIKKSGADVCHRCGKPGHWARGCKASGVSDNNNKDLPRGQALIAQATLCLDQSQCNEEIWYLDSGATDHMCNEKKYFINLEYFSRPLPVGVGKKDESVHALGRGDINILAFDGVDWTEKHLSRVLFVPNLRCNLFSAGTALDKGLIQISTAEGCRFEKNGSVAAVGVRKHKLCKMQFRMLVPDNGNMKANLACKNDLQTWHERLAHQNIRHVKQYLKTEGIQVTKKDDFFCEACVYGKAHRLPFPKRKVDGSRSQTSGELIHADVCGPFQTDSIIGSRYFLLFKDDFSHYKTVYFLKTKHEVAERMREFVAATRNLLGRDIRSIRSDNGLEFANSTVRDLLKRHGIQHQRTVTYTPEQNGSAERENRTIVESVRTMLHARNLPLKLWAEGVNTAVHILNRTGTSPQGNKTPYELWHGRGVGLHKPIIFGAAAYAHVPKERRRKLDSKATKGYFVGYHEDVKGFKIWYPETDRVEVKRDVIFNEDDSFNDFSSQARQDEDVQLIDLKQGVQAVQPLVDQREVHRPQTRATSPDRNQPCIENPTENPEPEHLEPEVQLPGVSVSSRVLRDRSQIKKPHRYDDHVDPDTIAFQAEIEEPQNYHEAITGPHAAQWRKAMDEEIESLRNNDTWDVVDRREESNPIKNRWVYKLKRRPDGDVERFKARLVVKGYSQKYGIDYHETYSPVVTFESIRIILALAASKGMTLQQFDIKTAFLNGNLRETVFMSQPEGYEDGTDNICRLNRSLYGLKQASRCWHERFTSFLKEFELEAVRSDPCVFVNHDKTLILAIYIDDGLIAASSKAVAYKLLSHLREEFEVTTGDLSLFLGFQIEQAADGSIFLHQSGYAKKVLERFHMGEANPVAVPMDKHQELSILIHGKQQPGEMRAPYREAVGSLMYLAVGTRPDIAFALSSVSQHLESPDKIHWNAVKRILKYLKGTFNFGLHFKTGASLYLLAFSDADYAGNIETRKSTSGCVFKLGESTISWCSQRQKVVALSTTESEFIAAAQAIKRLIWLERLVQEIVTEKTVKPRLLLDNMSAIKLLKNAEFNKRTKHIDVRYHFALEKMREGLFDLEYVCSKEQQADILTKPLLKEQFSHIRNLLNVSPKIKDKMRQETEREDA